MSNNTTTATLTDEATRRMIRPWLTGNDESDAQSLRRTFRMLRFSIGQWRQVIRETKAAA
jgi:hypothetical protein